MKQLSGARTTRAEDNRSVPDCGLLCGDHLPVSIFTSEYPNHPEVTALVFTAILLLRPVMVSHHGRVSIDAHPVIVDGVGGENPVARAEILEQVRLVQQPPV